MVYLPDMSSLSPTARVILGMLKLGLENGYEIKQACERTTKYFWRASYGQIYPELKRLEDEGLVRGADDPRGGVRRRRYRLTKRGERELDRWLESGDDLEVFLRDESLLKLFFGELVDRETLLRHVRRVRDGYAANLAALRATYPDADTIDDQSVHTLRYGLDFFEWNVGWWTALEDELSEGRPTPPHPAETAARPRR